MGAWRGDRAVTALELGVTGSWLNIPIFQAAWVAAPGALACEGSWPGLPAADNVPLSHTWAVCSPGWSPAPPSASFVPCGLGRWRGGFHSLSSPDPENNPLYSCDSPHALTSSSHVPRERRNLIPIGQMRTLRPKKGMGSIQRWPMQGPPSRQCSPNGVGPDSHCRAPGPGCVRHSGRWGGKERDRLLSSASFQMGPLLST